MAAQRAREPGGLLRDLDAVEIARPRQVDVEDLADPAWRGRHENYSIGETGGFTDGMRDENDRFAPLFPKPPDVAVKFLPPHSIEAWERFLHQEQSLVWRTRPRQRGGR